jgi:hypothetical protein
MAQRMNFQVSPNLNVRQNSMNQKSIVVLLAFASARFLADLQAQDGKPLIKPPIAEAELSLGRPGSEHEILARYSGEWESEVRMVSSNLRVIHGCPDTGNTPLDRVSKSSELGKPRIATS